VTRLMMRLGEELWIIRLKRETLSRSGLLLAAVFIVVSLFPSRSLGQTDVWLGGAGNWSDASKWSAGVPTSTSNVFIDNGNGPASVTVSGGYQCNNLTIDADAVLTISGRPGFSYLDISGTSVANAGKIVIDDTNGDAWINIAVGQNATLSGGGTVTLNDTTGGAAALIRGGGGTGATLTNMNNTIQGSGQLGFGNGLTVVNQTGGVINANQAGRVLYVNANSGVTNQGLMEASNAGSLTFSLGVTVNNSGGTISSSGSGSTVLLIDVTQGGTLKTSGGGVMQGENELDGATHGTLNNQGTFAVPANHFTDLIGTINNTGTFVLDDTSGDSSLNIVGGQNVMLTGGGTVTMNDTMGGLQAFISGGAGSTLTNVNNLIQGSGQIGQAGGLVLLNKKSGVVNANQAGRVLYINANGGAINQGLMEATNTSVLNLSAVVSNMHTIQTKDSGSQVLVPGAINNKGTFSVGRGTLFNITGTFSNFSGTTLTGGTYTVSGTMQFNGANIVNDAAHITVSGASAAIVDQTANDGLRNFAAITSKGSLTLASGKMLTTPANLSNAGKLTVGAGTNLKVTGSYTQTAGATTVDGTLTAPSGATIQAGSVFGKGTIASTVVSSGSFTAGDSPTRTAKLSPSTYTQNASGALNIASGGVTAGKQYGQLAVTNGAKLNGTLNLTLINNFIPAIGNTFTILACSALTGKFATVNGLSINSGEHFEITYNSTNITLTVVSGP
jgi:hypothetical protein